MVNLCFAPNRRLFPSEGFPPFRRELVLILSCTNQVLTVRRTLFPKEYTVVTRFRLYGIHLTVLRSEK